MMDHFFKRLYHIMARCIIKAVRDGGDLQSCQVEVGDDDAIDDITRVSQFGFSSNPPAGSVGVALFQGGERKNGVLIGTENPELRPKKLKSGESTVYASPKVYVLVKPSGEIVANGESLTVNAPQLLFASSNEFIGALADLCEALAMAKTATGLPVSMQPLDKAADFIALKQKFDGMKK